jgi:hypothetical protein
MEKPERLPAEAEGLDSWKHYLDAIRKDLTVQPDREAACPCCGKVGLLKDSNFAGHLCRPCWLNLGLRPERWLE